MRRRGGGLGVWPLVLAIVTAISLALADPPRSGAKPPVADPAPPVATVAVAAPSPAVLAVPTLTPGAQPAASSANAHAGSSESAKVFSTGMAPLSGGQRVPDGLLPPGAPSPDDGPSSVVFPPQKMTLRFNHKFHIQQGTSCKTCHASALTSASVADVLLPKGEVCDACHSTDHSDLGKVIPGDDESGKCAYCHTGYLAQDGNRVPRLDVPRANMVFNHQKHAARNIQCAQCHGSVDQLELATRDQLPRMIGCFRCHQRDDAASQGDATSACTTCHVREMGEGVTRDIHEAPGLNGGRMRTVFASGVLQPPRWLENSAHTPDFLERHRMVAAADSQLCANCHTEDYCTDCHDGRVRPRSIHPGDYISMHPVEARMSMQKCRSCHEEQSFCLTCHMRVGVAMSSPLGDRDSARFHPPKVVWSDVPITPQHHKFEAERNLNACVSCHTERDCVSCHGGSGVGGGFNPHRANFQAGCGSQFRRNPRPCLVCHEPSDGVLALCR